MFPASKILQAAVFLPVLDDSAAKINKVKRVIFCSGKLYYELLAYQEENKRADVALVRIEQFYPVPRNSMQKIIGKYKNSERFIWVQEEPENAGALEFFQRKLSKLPLEYFSRPEIGSPATGFSQQHKAEQRQLIENVFH